MKTNSVMTQILELAHFKIDQMNTFKDIKEKVIIRNEQMGNASNGMATVIKSQKHTPKMKNTLHETNQSPDGRRYAK
jgi:hypothetical protein